MAEMIESVHLLTSPDNEAAGVVTIGSDSGKKDRDSTHQQPKKFEVPEVITDVARQMELMLEDYNEMRILLVGKSGVGKSSFVNCLLQANTAPVGRVRPETNEVTEYDLTYNTDAGDQVTIRVYDTPGFVTKKKENEKSIKEIRKKCEVVDVIFLCIRMDDQLRAEDRQTIALLAKKFDDKFWKKCLIVFTRANMVKRMGQHTSESEKDYLKSVRDDLIADIRMVFQNAKVTLPLFLLAGAPEFQAEGRKIPNIDSNCDHDESVDWLPLVAAEIFKSGCSTKAKAVLLKSGWRKWAQVSAGTGAGTAVGVALGGGLVAAGVVTLALPPLGEIAIVIGGAVIIASLIAGSSASVGCGGIAAAVKSKTKKQIDKVLNAAERRVAS